MCCECVYLVNRRELLLILNQVRIYISWHLEVRLKTKVPSFLRNRISTARSTDSTSTAQFTTSCRPGQEGLVSAHPPGVQTGRVWYVILDERDVSRAGGWNNATSALIILLRVWYFNFNHKQWADCTAEIPLSVNFNSNFWINCTLRVKMKQKNKSTPASARQPESPFLPQKRISDRWVDIFCFSFI